MGKERTNYAVEISLRNEDAAKVIESIPTEQTPAAKIAGIAKGLVQELVDGGMMMPAQIVSRIRQSIDLQEPEDLIEYVERGALKKGAQDLYEVNIDPAYRENLKEQAQFCSVPVHQLVNEMISYSMDQGWWTGLPPCLHKVRFTDEQNLAIGRVLGKPEDEEFTGEELFQFLQDKFFPPSAPEVGEDPPLLVETGQEAA